MQATMKDEAICNGSKRVVVVVEVVMVVVEVGMRVVMEAEETERSGRMER